MKQTTKTYNQNQRFIPLKRLINYDSASRRKRVKESIERPLYQEALRSLFFVLFLFADAFIPLEMYQDLVVPYNTVGALVVLGILLFVEYRLYNAFWGKKGRWPAEKYRKTVEKAERKKK
jgi:hypothetical protein